MTSKFTVKITLHVGNGKLRIATRGADFYATDLSPVGEDQYRVDSISINGNEELPMGPESGVVSVVFIDSATGQVVDQFKNSPQAQVSEDPATASEEVATVVEAPAE